MVEVASKKDIWTTIMIKNIPNKYEKQELLIEINKKYKDCYDYFYMPVDVQNQCNLGYAFVNFVHAAFILEFY